MSEARNQTDDWNNSKSTKREIKNTETNKKMRQGNNNDKNSSEFQHCCPICNTHADDNYLYYMIKEINVIIID